MSSRFSRRDVLRIGGVAAAAGVLADVTGQATARAATVASPSALVPPRQLAALFGSPTAQQKAMTRTWFPDAGLGGSAAGLAYVASHFEAMAAAGFGGAEIAMPSDDTSYDNAQARTIGFGSPNWKNIVRQVLQTANAIPGGFKIDLTLSSHWPVAVDIIDPNDDAQQQQVTTAWAKITAADLAAGTMALPLPGARTQDGSPNPFGNAPLGQAPFIFVNKFQAAAVVKVASISGGTPAFALASLADVSARTAEVRKADGSPAGNAAGVPDQAWATANGVSYPAVVAAFGPDPASPDFPGKIDAAGDRRRMADWQYLYATDLAAVPGLRGYQPSAGTDLAVGDYVLWGIYRQGTGQVMSGGASVTQYNRSYVVDIYDQRAVATIASFWHEKILDEEMIALLRENARQNPSDAVFEDSFEVSHTSPLWPAAFLEAASKVNEYDAAASALVYALGSASSFDDTTAATRLLEDYVLTLSHLYETEHIAGIEQFAAEFGFRFKNQSEAGAPGVAGAEPGLGVVEGDNGSGDEGFRNMAGAVNLAGTHLVSDEALTFVAIDYATTWSTYDAALNQYWGTGVNRVNLHGTPFPVTFNGYNDVWPGWNYLGLGVFEPRQAWWSDITQYSGYIARNQGVLQAGVARVDLAVLEGSDARFTLPASDSLPAALSLGFSYNVLDEHMLQLPAATVRGGVLAPDGPAYRAVVVSQAARLSVAAVQALIGYARAGLPVVLYKCAITRVFGTSKADNSDQELASQLAILAGLPGVSTAATEAQVLSGLAAAGITPAASYAAPGLLAIRRQAPAADYYYLYCEGTSLVEPTTAGATGITVASTAGLAAGQRLIIDTSGSRETVTIASLPATPPSSGPNVVLTAPLTVSHAGPAAASGSAGAPVSAVVEVPVRLRGDGVPYLLDAWTGTISPVPAYRPDRDGVTVSLTLLGGESTIIALTPDGPGAPPHALTLGAGTGAASGGLWYTGAGTLVHRATTAGTYPVTLSDGRTETVTVASPPPVPSLAAGWDLSLESWGPDPAANITDPAVSLKTTVTFTAISLGDWAALPASPAQLSALGVTSMSQVSGIGTYATTFTLPASWSAADGAYLRLAHHVASDIVTGVTVNGRQLPAGNQFSDTFDLGPYLTAGRNTLTVRLDSTLNNRVIAAGGGGTGLGLGGSSGPQPYGLTGAELISYVSTPLAGR